MLADGAHEPLERERLHGARRERAPAPRGLGRPACRGARRPARLEATLYPAGVAVWILAAALACTLLLAGILWIALRKARAAAAATSRLVAEARAFRPRSRRRGDRGAHGGDPSRARPRASRDGIGARRRGAPADGRAARWPSPSGSSAPATRSPTSSPGPSAGWTSACAPSPTTSTVRNATWRRSSPRSGTATASRSRRSRQGSRPSPRSSAPPPTSSARRCCGCARSSSAPPARR